MRLLKAFKINRLIHFLNSANCRNRTSNMIVIRKLLLNVWKFHFINSIILYNIYYGIRLKIRDNVNRNKCMSCYF